MNQDRIQHELNRAIRQLCHNDGTPGFVFAYDTQIIDQLITDLQAKIDRQSEAIARRDGLLKQVWRYSENQPDNLNAWRIGKACSEAAKDPKCGDYIDRGLILLKALEEPGFGITRVE